MSQFAQKLLDDYYAAMEEERQLWQRMVKLVPTDADYQTVFEMWLAAAARTTLTSKALREAYAKGDEPPH